MPTTGQVRFTAKDTTYQAPDVPLAVKRRITMVFQRSTLMSRSVWHNVAYGLRVRGEPNIRDRVNAMLECFGLTSLADARPGTLSGGELQRVAIARALVLDPDILLLDEPTANLDPANIRLIEEAILRQQASTGMTIIIVIYNIFQARRIAGRVGLIYDGHLVEVAPTEQFFIKPAQAQIQAFINGNLVY